MDLNIHHITKASARVSGHNIGAKEEWWSATIVAHTPQGEHDLRLFFETREAAEAFDPTAVREQLKEVQA